MVFCIAHSRPSAYTHTIHTYFAYRIDHPLLNHFLFNINSRLYYYLYLFYLFVANDGISICARTYVKSGAAAVFCWAAGYRKLYILSSHHTRIDERTHERDYMQFNVRYKCVVLVHLIHIIAHMWPKKLAHFITFLFAKSTYTIRLFTWKWDRKCSFHISDVTLC